MDGEAAALERIPHRPPFLFLDRALERGPAALTTEWTVPPDADFLRGHYPGNPIVPGVLLCEHAVQSGALLCALEEEDAGDGAVPVLTRLAEARFRRAVRPGETVRTRVELVERLGPARWLRARVECAGEVALELEFTVARAAPAALRGA